MAYMIGYIVGIFVCMLVLMVVDKGAVKEVDGHYTWNYFGLLVGGLVWPLMLLVSILVFSEEWTYGLCDYGGDFDPVLVGLVIMFWPVLAIVLPVVALCKCVGLSLRIVKTKRFSRGE